MKIDNIQVAEHLISNFDKELQSILLSDLNRIKGEVAKNK